MSAMAWMAQQLEAAALSVPQSAQRHNPNPPGAPQPGCTTEAVLTFMRSAPARFFTEIDLVRALGRTRASVSWSLVYARQQGWIEAMPDTRRNARYLRYRLVATPPIAATKNKRAA